MTLSEKGIAPCPDGAPGWRARERFMSCFENTRRETRSRNIIVSIIYSPCGPRNHLLRTAGGAAPRNGLASEDAHASRARRRSGACARSAGSPAGSRRDARPEGMRGEAAALQGVEDG